MILNSIRKAAKEKLEESNKDNFIIRGIWAVDCLFNPNPKERVFNYKFIVAQTVGQGCAYSVVKNYEVNDLKKLMGKNYFDLNLKDLGLEVSLLDSIFAEYQPKPDLEVEIQGNSIEKSVYRADIIVDEAMRLAGDKKNPLVANVGVVGNIIKGLLDRGAEVVGSDFDAQLVGKKLFGQTEIVHGDHTLEWVKQSDVAIVTGMTLTTETMDEIIEVAKENHTKVLIFAETGSHLGEFYLNAGADVVVSEPFPFYIFQGKSVIRIFRRK